MNEKLQYAEMLDIPVNTCNITYKPTKRKLFKKQKINSEQVKTDLMNKVNGSIEENATPELPVTESSVNSENVDLLVDEGVEAESISPSENPIVESSVSVRDARKVEKKAFKFSVIAFQITLIGVLITTILITNALVPTSGINNFINNAFGVDSAAKEDVRVYSDFTPELHAVDGMVLDNGVMTFAVKGSLYSPCDGTVTVKTLEENGKYTIEIEHNKNFKSILKGVDYAYCNVGENVLSNIPVGYSLGEEVSLCFCGGDGNVITDFSVNDNAVVWAV